MRVTQDLDAASIEKLRADFRGPLILPGDGQYERARVVWNAIADRHPALIARCTRVACSRRRASRGTTISSSRSAVAVTALRGSRPATAELSSTSPGRLPAQPEHSPVAIRISRQA